MKNSSLCFMLFLLMSPALVLAQRKSITGRVVAAKSPQTGILVVNLDAEREARTDSNGIFTLMAQEGDSLIVTDISITPASAVVTRAFFTSTQDLVVQLNDSYMLDEVVVEENRSLSAEGLGIIPAGIKKFTPGERRLKEASEIKMNDLLQLKLPVNQIINAISGRTKQMKKDLEVEKRELALETIQSMFTTEEIVEQFKIPQEYVPAFLYYCVEDPELSAAIKQKNETLATFLMTGLSQKYLEILMSADAEPDGQ